MIAAPYMATSGHGVSDDARLVQDRLDQFRLSMAQPIAISGSRNSAFNALAETYEEAMCENWDGYGANPVSPVTLDAGFRFLEALPITIPCPEVSPEPDGEISFEWYAGHRRVFSVSVGSSNRLAYAGLMGSAEWHGADTFFDEIPNRVIRDIQSVAGV